MQLLQETHTVFGTSYLKRRDPPTPREVGKYQKHANTKQSETGKAVPGTSWLLQEICAPLCRHF